MSQREQLLNNLRRPAGESQQNCEREDPENHPNPPPMRDAECWDACKEPPEAGRHQQWSGRMAAEGGNGKSMQCVNHASGEPAERTIDAKTVLESTRMRQRRDKARDANAPIIPMLQRHSRHQQENSRHGRQSRIFVGSCVNWCWRSRHGEFSIGGSRCRES